MPDDSADSLSIIPEQELLFRCARTRMSPSNSERLAALCTRGIDWTLMVRLASFHRVMPLIYRNLRKTCPECVPSDVLDKLQSRSRRIALRNLFLTSELIRLLRLLQAHNIRGVPFKGPTLADRLYGDISLRQFDDLDILVLESDVLLAKEVFLSNGYQLSFSPQDEQEYIREHHELNFLRKDGAVSVDIEWRFATRIFAFPLNPQTVWERLESVDFQRTKTVQTSSADLLLLLCGHGTKHCWSRLRWITDIDAFVNHYHGTIDWGQLLERVSRMGGERMVLLGLHLASELLETDLPKEIGQKIDAAPAVRKLTEQVARNLFWDPENLPDGHFDGHQLAFGAFGFFERMSFYIQARERFRDKVPCARHVVTRVASRVFLPSELDRALVQLPRSLSWLYFFIRPIRLLGSYGLQLTKK